MFRQLLSEGKSASIKTIFGKMHRKWQTTIVKNLISVGENEIADLLKKNK